MESNTSIKTDSYGEEVKVLGEVVLRFEVGEVTSELVNKIKVPVEKRYEERWVDIVKAIMVYPHNYRRNTEEINRAWQDVLVNYDVLLIDENEGIVCFAESGDYREINIVKVFRDAAILEKIYGRRGVYYDLESLYCIRVHPDLMSRMGLRGGRVEEIEKELKKKWMIYASGG